MSAMISRYSPRALPKQKRPAAYRQRTYLVRWESMTGVIRQDRIRAADEYVAVDALAADVGWKNIGNLLAVFDSKGVKLI